MTDSHQLLAVSFFYPPNPAIGGRRVAKFVRYLPEYGWEATVLTAQTHSPHPDPAEKAWVVATPWWSLRGAGSSDPGHHRTGRDARPSLRERMEGGGALARAAYRALRHVAPLSTVRMPDATLGWIPYAVAEGTKLLEQRRFAAIFSSFGPPSSHIVAARLQARSGLPWIADYRDLWSANHWDRRIRPFSWIESRLERRVLKRAAGFTTVGPDWARRLESLHGRPAEVVYNGFDPSDYPDPSLDPGDRGRFILTYVGSMYWPGQDPEPLFAALSRLEARAGRKLDAARFQLRFLGTACARVDELASRHGVAHRTQRLPQVTYRESLGRQRASTALLFLGWNDPREGFLTAKLFEYLGAGRPILGVGPSGGTVSELMAECGQEVLTSDPGVISDRLDRWIDEFLQTGTLASGGIAAPAQRFTRQAQTATLAKLLDRLTSSPPAP